jgi:glutathione-regulated potassium-efflux system ancillary protein KefC
MDQHGFLVSTVIYLTAAVIAVPLAKRLGLGSVLGFLFAGIAIGPWVLGLIDNVEDILNFSQFGVVLLLFLIGLELNPTRLRTMRRLVFGMGGAQVAVTTLVLTFIGLAPGLIWSAALVAALGLSLSATALALQALREKNLQSTEAGSASLAVLLFQDIAVIPVLVLLPLLGTTMLDDTGEAGWLTALKALAVIALIIAGGHYLLRPIFRIIARTDSREIFTAFSLLLVVGIALAMDAVGLSMALGAFMAGVLLADSEYRHELEIDIEPFKGLLLGLFFIAVGMSVDFGLLLARPMVILGLVLGLVLVKLSVLWLVGFGFGLRGSQNWLFAFALSQGGEFSFVLFKEAVPVGALDPITASTLTLVAALSLLTTPLLMLLYDRLFMALPQRKGDGAYDSVDEDKPVIIGGFGRFGQVVTRLLHAKGIPTTLIDHDANQIEVVRRFGWKAYYGEISRPDLLHAAGIARARLLILAIDDTEAALTTARYVRERYPEVRILVRVRNRQEVYEFMKLGVTAIFRETFGSALDMGEAALRELGFRAYRAKRSAQRFRLHDLETLHALFPFHQDEASYISKTKEARQDLERLLSERDEAIKDYDESWG